MAQLPNTMASEQLYPPTISGIIPFVKVLLFSALALVASASLAELPRVLPPGEFPKDVRLGPLKDLDGYFPFTPPSSREKWAKRAEEVRTQMRVALGLWPEPTRTPLNAVIHGRIDGDDYTVEKVYFESMPGLFVTGNLYRPKKEGTEKHPAVLCPHGHWDEARFRLLGDAELKKELESGGEHLANGGRSIFQSLGVQLARIGCIAFVYDMLGYCDSRQISMEIAHKFAKQRPEMNAPENWGLYSPQAETHAQSILGLQTWNSMRALDFLAALPDVDPARLACTGASGGGTQTMILGALDPRLAVECPAVMVSTAMQGGCTCENASLLRVNTGNIEFAALFAPKPLGMTAANDWTKEMPAKGYPELQRHYALMGAPDHVQLWPMLQFPHNYNAPSREKIYGWFNKYFGLGLADTQLVEHEYTVLHRQQLTVWDADHPAPPEGPEFERKLLRWWHEDAQKQFANSTKNFREIAAPAWKAIIGRSLEDSGNVVWEERKELLREVQADQKKYRVHGGILRNTTRGEELPALIIESTVFSPGERTPRCAWLDEAGKRSVFTPDGTGLRAEVRAIADSAGSVLAIDCFSQGEFLPDDAAVTKTRKVNNPREAAAYTFGYNPALFAQRVHDALTAIHYCNRDSRKLFPAKLVAFGAAGPIAAAARALAGDAVEAAIIDTNGFEFADVTQIDDPNFLPAAAKYGGVAGLLALAAPAETCVVHKGPDAPDLARSTYVNLQAGDRLFHVPASDTARSTAIDWLLNRSPQQSRRIAK